MKKILFISLILCSGLFFKVPIYANSEKYEYEQEDVLSNSAIEVLSLNTLDISNGDCIISSNGNYVIYGTSETNIIEIKSNVSANITIKNLSISSNKSPIRINNKATVNLFLEGTNNLKVKRDGYAGIFVGNEANLTIEGTGSLDVTGGDGASGIGSNLVASDPENQYSYEAKKEKGNIEIKSGTITARGGIRGAGIGGYVVYSQLNDGKVLADVHAITGKTIISGGTVTAYGGDYAAGIGGCWYEGTGNTIEINGGNVKAYGGYCAPGIGFGYGGFNSNRCVNGDIIFNGGTVNSYGGEGAAGIGASCESSHGVNIEIYGGNIYAEGNGGAGINLSGNTTRDADCGWLEVEGGVVTAVGNNEVGIYNKYYDVWINSGSVKTIGVNGENDISVRKYINNYKTNEIVNLNKFKAKDVVSVYVDNVDWKIYNNHPNDEYIYLYLPESAKKVTIKTKNLQQEFILNKSNTGDAKVSLDNAVALNIKVEDDGINVATETGRGVVKSTSEGVIAPIITDTIGAVNLANLTNTDFTITDIDSISYNATSKTLSITVGGKEYKVLLYLGGDSNGDGKVGIADALIAVRISNEDSRVMNTVTGRQLVAADVNGDGSVKIADALLIVRYSNADERVQQLPVFK